MKRLLIFGVLVLPVTVAALDESDFGTRIYGANESSTGLFLMPWEKSELSDIDRPPRLLNEKAQQVDADSFYRYLEWQEARSAYRRWRLQRNNW